MWPNFRRHFLNRPDLIQETPCDLGKMMVNKSKNMMQKKLAKRKEHNKPFKNIEIRGLWTEK